MKQTLTVHPAIQGFLDLLGDEKDPYCNVDLPYEDIVSLASAVSDLTDSILRRSASGTKVTIDISDDDVLSLQAVRVRRDAPTVARI